MNTFYNAGQAKAHQIKMICALVSCLFLSYLNVNAQQWQYVGSETGISAGGSSFNNIAKDASGNIYISYYDLSVTKGSVQKYDGTSWSYLGGSPGITTGFATYSSLCTDAAGNVYYTNQNSGMEVRKFTANAWTMLPKVTNNTINYQSSAVTPGGTLVAANNESNGTVKRFVNGAWEQIGTTGFAGALPTYLDMVTGSDNMVYVCYVSGGTVNVMKNDVNAPSTQSWTLVGGVTVAPATGSEQFRSAIAIDGGDNIYVAYTSLSAAGNKINVRKFNGTTWTQIGAENFSEYRVHYVNIAVSPAGVPYVIFSNFENSPNNKNSVMKFNGSAWEAVGTTVSEGEAKYNNIIFDSNNNLYAVYTDGSLSSKTAAKKFVINESQTPVQSIAVATANNAPAEITTDEGTLQLTATILPANASQNVVWSITQGSDLATISQTGLITAASNGTITVRAASAQDATVYGEITITLSNQVMPYCDAYLINGCNDLSIASVTTTGGYPNLNNTSTGCLNSSFLNGYSNYSTVVFGAEKTSTLTFNFNLTGSLVQFAYLSVWIDWNRNYTFDENELVYVSQTEEVNGIVQFTVNVPATAVTGETRVRCKAVSGWAGSGPCGYNSIGEVEDYTINILPEGTMPGVTVTTVDNADASITVNDGTLQLNATVTPATAPVNWTVISGTSNATVDANGLVSATNNGTVIVRAALASDATIHDDIIITITNQIIAVTGVEITPATAQTITVNEGTLQLTATIAPANATNTDVTWSIVNGSEFATIDENGLVTAVANGVVTVRVTSNTDATIYDEVEIVISNQYVAVTALTVSVADDAEAVITTAQGTLQLEATITPADATNANVTWTIVSGNEFAAIDENGLVTATSNGTVTVRATAQDNDTLFDEIDIVISNQYVAVTALTVSVADDAEPVITTAQGTLQLEATITPADATDADVTWSIVEGEEFATIDENGFVTAVANGTVTIRATSDDDDTIFDEIEVTINVQVAGIDDHAIAKAVMYPNPSSGIVNISSVTPVKTVVVYTMTGQKVMESTQSVIDISTQQQGVYLIQITLENGSITTQKLSKI
ncbi:MAG: hypothetical protein DI539_03160 [Flavobacterium psychrophilum]|nr:MAG: hypothetical protein DI539_03160 [Flavobacterium psychrophilum]